MKNAEFKPPVDLSDKKAIKTINQYKIQGSLFEL